MSMWRVARSCPKTKCRSLRRWAPSNFSKKRSVQLETRIYLRGIRLSSIQGRISKAFRTYVHLNSFLNLNCEFDWRLIPIQLIEGERNQLKQMQERNEGLEREVERFHQRRIIEQRVSLHLSAITLCHLTKWCQIEDLEILILINVYEEIREVYLTHKTRQRALHDIVKQLKDKNEPAHALLKYVPCFLRSVLCCVRFASVDIFANWIGAAGYWTTTLPDAWLKVFVLLALTHRNIPSWINSATLQKRSALQRSPGWKQSGRIMIDSYAFCFKIRYFCRLITHIIGKRGRRLERWFGKAEGNREKTISKNQAVREGYCEVARRIRQPTWDWGRDRYSTGSRKPFSVV